MKAMILTLSLMFGLVSINNLAKAHCEIPCGIYGDDLRLALLDEHITTIEKSIKAIRTLSSKKKLNHNQIVRWVSNKDAHATKFQEIVSQYFLHQRIKPVDSSQAKAYQKYISQLTLAHQMLILAMKTKTSTDLTLVAELRQRLGAFRKVYP